MPPSKGCWYSWACQYILGRRLSEKPKYMQSKTDIQSFDISKSLKILFLHVEKILTIVMNFYVSLLKLA